MAYVNFTEQLTLRWQMHFTLSLMLFVSLTADNAQQRMLKVILSYDIGNPRVFVESFQLLSAATSGFWFANFSVLEETFVTP